MTGLAGPLLLGALLGGPMEAPMHPEHTPTPLHVRAYDPAPGMATIRALYLAAVADEAAIERGMQEIEGLRAHLSEAEIRGLEPLLTAYRGALETLRAKHALWPPAKLRHLRAGLEVLDAAVTAHPEHAEVRYLRLMSCFYLPAVLGRKDSVREDFAALARLLPRARSQYPDELYRAIARFVLERGELSAEQRAPLKSALGAADG